MLGPFPQEGEYEHVFTIQRPDGSFLPLVPHVCETIVQAVIFSRNQPYSKRKAALEERERRKRQHADDVDDAIIRNALEPMFYGQPHVGYQGQARKVKGKRKK